MPEHTIAENLQRLIDAKTAIGSAITAKSGTVGADDGLEEFAADIMSIKNDLTSIDITENGTYYSGDETIITSSTFPVVVNDSNGTPVRHADINGNAVQSSTPTPDNPVMPQGTGERTGNLFDIKILQNNKGISSYGNVFDQNGRIATVTPINISEYSEVTLTYTEDNVSFIYATFNSGTLVERVGGKKSGYTIDTTNCDSLYICFYGSSSITKDDVSEIMLNTGSEALPYEPWGIEIPISSADTSKPVYLGEVQSARRVKKLVLTGEETINSVVLNSASTGYCFVYKYEDLGMTDIINYERDMREIPYPRFLSTHFKNKPEPAGIDSYTNIAPGEIGGNSITANLTYNRFVIMCVNGIGSKENFQAYLTAQYAAGTPVTVWYVLGSETTGIVNEPLMKIEEYADTLSVDVELPLSQNTKNNIDVNTTLKPSLASFTYNKLSEYIGYNEINVDVSNTYTAEDEGKVVNNATLVAQTTMPVEITVNDTYDTTLYNSIVVNVPDIVGHTFIVATIPNAVVTVTNASNTYTATADNVGEALFKSVAAGTYDVMATYDDAVSDTTFVTIADHTVTEDSFARLTISASDNTTITVTDGTVTKTLTYTGTPIVQYVSLGSWDLSCVIDGTVITRTVLVGSYTNQNIRLSQPISRYVDFTTNTTTIAGDPNTHPVYMCINRCNVSDNGTINAYYGDVSYVENGSNGQVMVKIPKFYYKVIPDTDGGLDNSNIRKCTWKISDSLLEGYTLHPAFYDAAGNEIDYFLYGAFDGVGQNSAGTYGTSYNTTAAKLSSVAGSSYLPTSSMTRETSRIMAANRGTGWYQIGVKQTMAVMMLFVVEHGFNSQIAVGQGVVSTSSATYAGRTTGNITSGTQNNKMTPVNWRGIENLWGNIWNWIDGLNIDDRVPYFCNSYAFVDDTSTGYTRISFSLPSLNYITALGYDHTNDWILLPSEASSTSNPTGPIGDRVVSNSGWCVARLGSYWDAGESGSDAGIFFWGCHIDSSEKNGGVGARLMFIPTGAA